MTNEHFTPVAAVAELDSLFAQSRDEPVILFKHDPYCPISAAAYRQMSRLPGDIPLIDVARAKDVAREVAERTGVRHESPQVLVLRDGQAAWSASHYEITADAVTEAVAQAG